MSAGKYRTIVADPPWPIGDMPAFAGGYAGPRKPGDLSTGTIPLGYPTMDLAEIESLRVQEFAAPNSHLYLWAVSSLLCEAYDVARAWGFRPVKPLVWSKAPRGLGPGGTFANTTEFVLFCRRGSLKAKGRVDRTCWEWKRPYGPRGIIGSAKPDGFFDLVEQVSPGPYLELFARRQRLGWDTWGDEALEHVQIGAA